jgi:hypothetical protein
MRGAPDRKTDRFGFWVRFTCGALFGLLTSIRIVLYFYDESPVKLALLAASVTLLCGFSAAQLGDRFWY